MKSTNERDSHFFLAGWNGARRDVDATEHFQNASKTAPESCLHQIQEPTVNHQLTIERDAFEKWLGIKPCGAAHDFGWEAWKARAALAATKIKSDSLEQFNENKGLGVVLPEPDDSEFEQQLPIQPIGVMGGGNERRVLWNCTFMPEAGTSFYTEQQVRALLATGGQAQAVEGG